MSTIAGVVGLRSTERERACSDILLSQRIYGGVARVIETAGETTFGASRHDDLAPLDTQGLMVVCDARLDNREELISALGLAGGPDQPTDSRLFQHAWQKWGRGSLDRIYGDYAIAVHDRGTSTLTLARDPTGQRPLFYKADGSALAFASMPSGLRRLFTPSDFNLELLAHCLEQRADDPKASYFERIEKVQAGELIEFRNARLRRQFHWNPAVAARSDLNDKDYVETYRALLDQAVASRLQGKPRPVGSHLSAGWDSSAVTATAARLIGPGKDLIAFTSAPLAGVDAAMVRHRLADESAVASETAEMHGLGHVVIRQTEPLWTVLARQTALMQQPIFAAFNITWIAEIRRRARDAGVRTLLTGELGNSTLNVGGLYALEQFIRGGRWRAWWHEAKTLTKRPDVRWRGILLNSFMPWLPDGALRGLQRMFLGVPSAKHRSFVRQRWTRMSRSNEAVQPSAQSIGVSLLQGLRLSDYGSQRQAALAGHGIEECDPLSDRRIVEFALQLPPEQMVRDGVLRPLARNALRDRVPASVLDAKARGFQGADWHLRVSASEARDVLETISPHAAVQELLDLKRMAEAIDRWPTRDFNSFETFMTYRDGLVSALATGLFISSPSPGP